MRKFVPLLLLIAAALLYEGREVVLSPLLGGGGAPLPSEHPADEETAGAGNEAARADLFTRQVAASPPREGRISRGRPFFVEMRDAGLPPDVVQQIVTASKGLVDFRKVKPGQRYSLFEGTGGELDSLHFWIDSERILKVSRRGEGFGARQDTIPYRVEHYVSSGTIEGSIYLTLQKQGADPELASMLAVIFQWDIDFFKDIRPGDTFTILYESRVFENGRKVLGDVLAAKVLTRGEEHFAFAYRSRDGETGYYDEKGKSLEKTLLRAPLTYRRISSNFTRRRLHPVTRTYRPHLGVDYVAPRGTPVRATGDGTIEAATRHRYNGNYVKIRHNRRYTTYYLHLQGFARGIRSGKRVHQGDVIGYLGSTGLVTAPHLDYRIKVDGRFVNPRTIRLPSERPVPAGELKLFCVTRDACLVRFLDIKEGQPTVLVERPRPPQQGRMLPAL